MEKKKLTAGKVILRIFLWLISIFAVICISFAAFLFLGKSRTMAVPIEGVSLVSVADGSYEGSYSGFRWSNTVSVTVKDHQIVSIEQLKPQVITKADTIDTLVARVIAAQNTDIDVITGATVSSKAFLSAVEDALD